MRLIPIILFIIAGSVWGSTYTLTSPDNNVAATVTVADRITWQLTYKSMDIVGPSPASLSLADGAVLGQNARVKSAKTIAIDRTVKTVYGKYSGLQDQCNELTILFKDNFSFVCRAYNDGFAYRFQTNLKKRIKVENEEVSFNFTADHGTILLEADHFHAYEDDYKHKLLSAVKPGNFLCLPALVRITNGPTVVITEADLLDYPGLYLQQDPSQKTALKGIFPPYPTSVAQDKGRGFNLQVLESGDYIADTAGTRGFPWRVLAIAAEEKQLIENDLVYLLASECALDDVSWIKPGKVAWDWWNDNNMTGVDFKTGFNTETYKYYIDFAADNGIPYVNLDEGWSDQFNLLKVATKLDMEEVVAYARAKNVGLILWCVWHTLDRQLQQALDQFAAWGIAGVKVDFMDRDDQLAVNFYERCAREAAERKILVNYHGAFKPTGLRRTLPNVINREGVMGMEYSKWSNRVTPEHDVTIPFIRMLAGPMDFTPGAMMNASKNTFAPIFSRPMAQGTRCHQLAMYVVYYAPLQMLSDAPTSYQKEPEVLEFIAPIPTTWDESRGLDGMAGEFVAVARRSGDVWYVAAMCNETARTIRIDFSFLGQGRYQAVVFQDGINAERNALDYKKMEMTVSKDSLLDIQLAPGGGWAAKVEKK